MLTTSEIQKIEVEVGGVGGGWGTYHFIAHLALFHVRSPEDLEVVYQHFHDAYKGRRYELRNMVNYYKSMFDRWPNPVINEEMSKKYSKAVALFDRPQKVRALLAFCESSNMPPHEVIKAIEHLLKARDEQEGASSTLINHPTRYDANCYKTSYNDKRGYNDETWCRADVFERLSYFTQGEYDDFRAVVGICGGGCGHGAFRFSFGKKNFTTTDREEEVDDEFAEKVVNALWIRCYAYQIALDAGQKVRCEPSAWRKGMWEVRRALTKFCGALPDSVNALIDWAYDEEPLPYDLTSLVKEVKGFLEPHVRRTRFNKPS